MVQYPKMRGELLETLRSLASREYQEKAWINHNYPAGVLYDSFDEAVHFLFDDTILAENPNTAIGVILETEKEARLIAAVCTAIEQLLEAHGTEMSDKEFINSAEWTNVVGTASLALQVITNEQISSSV